MTEVETSRLDDENLKNIIATSYKTFVKITDNTSIEQDVRYAVMSIGQSNLAIVELLQRILDENKSGFNK